MDSPSSLETPGATVGGDGGESIFGSFPESCASRNDQGIQGNMFWEGPLPQSVAFSRLARTCIGAKVAARGEKFERRTCFSGRKQREDGWPGKGRGRGRESGQSR